MKNFKEWKKAAAFALAAVLLLAGCSGKEEADKTAEEKKDDTVKAGFVYVGPVGDGGWSYAHDLGRAALEEKYDWLETVYVESVPEADSARVIDRFVNEEKVDVVFTTSFGYMDDTLKAGKMYPDVVFEHCSGFKRSDNVGTYFAELYQMYYLNGLMAGALTESNKVGYVATFPIPELLRHINAFALGVKDANPEAVVDVRWIYTWVGPAEAREAAESLISAGCDALAFTEDTQAVIEVAQEHTEKGKQVYSFSHYSAMQQYGPDSVVSGQLVNWEIMYDKILSDIHAGTWKSEDLWWRAAEGAAELGGNRDEKINPAFVDDLKAVGLETEDLGEISAYDLIMKRLEQMKDPAVSFEPFSGPIKDQEGTLRIEEGRQADAGALLSMDYFVDNVVAPLPKN